MKNPKKKFLKHLVFLSVIFVFALKAIAAESSPEYELYYPKFVDSKEPLSKLRLKDGQDFAQAEKNLSALSLDLDYLSMTPKTIHYGAEDLQQIDIYSTDSGNKLKPVIFFIHAGASDKNTAMFAAPAWLSLGYDVVSINYRSAPAVTFFKTVQDCSIALKWVIDHIQSYGGDPNRIALTGTSCGAHLAALLVTDASLHEKYGIDIFKIKCWFPMSGFYDTNLKENYISPTIKDYIKWINTSSKYDASVVDHIIGKAPPPSLIIHGGDDWCVPKSNATALYDRLRERGANTQLTIVKGYMHANIYYNYLNPDHVPAKLIKQFLATYLPTESNH